jgi:hypothetical protein
MPTQYSHMMPKALVVTRRQKRRSCRVAVAAAVAWHRGSGGGRAVSRWLRGGGGGGRVAAVAWHRGTSGGGRVVSRWLRGMEAAAGVSRRSRGMAVAASWRVIGSSHRAAVAAVVSSWWRCSGGGDASSHRVA